MAKVAAKAKDRPVKKKQTVGMKILTILFSIVSVFYVAPVFIVLMNSFKSNAAISRAIFEFPNADSFQGFQSYMTGMFHGNYPFWKSIVWSFFITIGGVVLILFCTSMCAWYLQRSNSRICKIIYYFCIFSMVIPFQMVMFTLSKTADSLKLTTPWGILIIYLGFGAGLAVFMFSGFVKSIPVEIEEAADVDGAGPLRTFFGIVLPIMKPTFISVAILETMWIWNDYLLPYLILDMDYKTIPIHIQYLNGSYGHTCHYGAYRSEYRSDYYFLLCMSEIHHRGCCFRCCKRLIFLSFYFQKTAVYIMLHSRFFLSCFSLV